MASSWIRSKLSDFINVKHGFAFMGQYFTENSDKTVLLTPGNFRIGGGFKEDKPKGYSGPIPHDYVLNAGDLILTMTDLSRAADTLGYPAFVPVQANRIFLHNQRLGKVEMLPGAELDARFLYYLFCSAPYRSEIVGGATGSTVKHTSPTRIMNFVFDKPSFEEQIRIGNTMYALDARRTALEQQATQLDKLARAIFMSWFVDFDPVWAKAEGREPESMDAATSSLFPNTFDDTVLGRTPKGWSVGRLDDLLVLQRGFDLPHTQRTRGEFPVIAASGPSGTHNKCKVKGPGVVTGRSGVLGNVYWVDDDFWPLNTSLWVKDFRRATPAYAYQHLRLLDLSQFNAGSAVPTLNRNHIHGLPTLIPPESVVKAFDEVVEPLFQKLRLNCQMGETLRELRDTLLPRLISGKLRVPEASKLVGAIL